MIADLAVNHVERHVLLAGHVIECVRKDYGIDLLMITFDRLGRLEPGQVRVQVKATDKARTIRGGDVIPVRVEMADVRTWMYEPGPVALVVFDATREIAYWINIKEVFRRRRKDLLAVRKRSTTIHVPIVNVLDSQSIQQLAAAKRKLIKYPDRRVN